MINAAPASAQMALNSDSGARAPLIENTASVITIVRGSRTWLWNPPRSLWGTTTACAFAARQPSTIDA